MSQAADLQGDFTWAGVISDTGIEAVFERCQRLRLTGRLRLSDGERQAELAFVGGQPGDTEATEGLLDWQQGQFQFVQLMPDLQGQLTAGVELSGELSLGQVQRIAQLCSDFRLSADLYLERSTGDRAQVGFTHGRADSASIGGQPQTALQALALLAVWHRGRYQVRLRPLFGEDAPEAPIFIEKRSSKGDFDITGTIEIPQLDREGRLVDSGRRRASQPPASRSRPPAPSRPPADLTAQTAPQLVSLAGPPSGSGEPTVTLPEVTRPAAPAARAPSRPVWARALLVGLVGGSLAFAATLGGRLWLRQHAPSRAAEFQVPAPAPEKAPATAPPVAPRSPAAAPDPGGPAGAGAGPAASAPARSREQQAQFERALRLILEGRIRKAQELVAQLRQQLPDDADVALMERQARGELGRGEIVVTGTGTAMVNGHSYAAPYRLRVPAGLYLVNGERRTLAEGEKLEVGGRTQAPLASGPGR